jgi:hypothetical protein
MGLAVRRDSLRRPPLVALVPGRTGPTHHTRSARHRGSPAIRLPRPVCRCVRLANATLGSLGCAAHLAFAGVPPHQVPDWLSLGSARLHDDTLHPIHPTRVNWGCLPCIGVAGLGERTSLTPCVGRQTASNEPQATGQRSSLARRLARAYLWASAGVLGPARPATAAVVQCRHHPAERLPL